MRDVRVELAGTWTTAAAASLGQKLSVTAPADGVRAFTLPRVGEYEVVVLE
jgi:hypothetical protein